MQKKEKRKALMAAVNAAREADNAAKAVRSLTHVTSFWN